MSVAGQKLIEGVKEALAVSRGETPAARIHHQGHSYVPENRWRCDPPPKDRPILVWGRPTDIEGVRFLIPSLQAAYWDEIDSSYCIKGATWLGPFIEFEWWMDEPSPPPLIRIEP